MGFYESSQPPPSSGAYLESPNLCFGSRRCRVHHLQGISGNHNHSQCQSPLPSVGEGSKDIAGVSCSSGWPQIHRVANNDPGLFILLPPPLTLWGSRDRPPHPPHRVLPNDQCLRVMVLTEFSEESCEAHIFSSISVMKILIREINLLVLGQHKASRCN